MVLNYTLQTGYSTLRFEDVTAVVLKAPAFCCVMLSTGPVDHEFSKHHSAFIFKAKQPMKKGLLDPENEGIMNLQMKCGDQHHIPEACLQQQLQWQWLLYCLPSHSCGVKSCMMSFTKCPCAQVCMFQLSTCRLLTAITILLWLHHPENNPCHWHYV